MLPRLVAQGIEAHWPHLTGCGGKHRTRMYGTQSIRMAGIMVLKWSMQYLADPHCHFVASCSLNEPSHWMGLGVHQG